MMSVRRIPSVDQLLQRPALVAAAAAHGQETVTAAARRAATALRARLVAGGDGLPESESAAIAWLEAQTLDTVAASLAPSLVRVIDACGRLHQHQPERAQGGVRRDLYRLRPESRSPALARLRIVSEGSMRKFVDEVEHRTP